MEGAQYMTYGVVLFVLGAALTYAAGIYDLPVFALYGGYGLLGLAAASFFPGLILSLMQLTFEPKGHDEEDVKVALSVLLRCMVAMSVADDHLDEREERMIAKIYEQLVGQPLSAETIRETASHMQEGGVNLIHELEHLEGRISGDMKAKIMKASLYILAADGQVDEGEEAKLDEVRVGLSISKLRYEKIKTAFLQSKGLA